MSHQRIATMIETQLQVGAGASWQLRFFSDDGSGNPGTEANTMRTTLGDAVAVSTITDGSRLTLNADVDSAQFDLANDNHGAAPVDVRHIGLVETVSPATNGFVSFADMADGQGVKSVPDGAFLRVQSSNTNWDVGKPSTIGTGQGALFQDGLAHVFQGALTDVTWSQPPSWDEFVLRVSVGGTAVTEFKESTTKALPMQSSIVSFSGGVVQVAVGMNVDLEGSNYETGISINFADMHVKNSAESLSDSTIIAKDDSISETTSDPGFVSIPDFTISFN